MPKRSSAARGSMLRQKQKSFELVLPETTPDSDDVTPVTATESTIETTPRKSDASSATATATKTRPAAKKASVAATTETQPADETAATPSATTTKTSASARLAARRQSTQRVQQQRSASTMITAEHFAYAKRDLALIGTLAVIFFTTIVVLYFVIL
jgi:hypothetical protein